MKKMFLVVLCLCLYLTTTLNSLASGGYKYSDMGGIYTGVTFPQDVANDANITDETKLSNLKKGQATSTNFLYLFDVGNSGIEEARKNGGITKIHYVDKKIDKVYIPLLFLPIYAKSTTTVVYGE